MTKQKKMRKGVALLINLEASDEVKDRIANAIIRYLDSEGVVLKVERELPVVQWNMTGADTPSQAKKIGEAFRKAYADYVAVGRLF